jgi:hypothetical protein
MASSPGARVPISTSTSNRSLRYILAWLLLVALPGSTWYLVTTGPLRAVAFRVVVPESAYLANLRSSRMSCESVALRRPQAVVIGDSHSYAGWDFAELQRRLGLRIGSCALGGLYLETVPQLVDYVAASSPEATLLILGLAPRLFWESPTKKEQVASHRKLLSSMKQDAAPYLSRLISNRPLPYDREVAAVARQANRIEALDERVIAARLAQSEQAILSLRLWVERLAVPRRTLDLSATVGEICGRVRTHNLRLWVLHIPESPWLEARYPDHVWEGYVSGLKALSSCAEKVVADKAMSFGLGNRHYVNRDLRDDHDYGWWEGTGSMADDRPFDADHLNPVGAARFTKEVLGRLGGTSAPATR